MDETERELPSSIVAEQSLLGGLMLNNASFDDVADIVGEKDFFRVDHQAIFAGMRKLSKANESFDPVTLADAVQLQDWAYVVSLARNACTDLNGRHYARIIRDKSLERGLLLAADEINRTVYEHGDVREKIDHVAGIVGAITDQRTVVGPRTMRELLPDWIAQLDETYKRDGGLVGISCGFELLDTALSGLGASDLIVLAARPSMGKTTLAMNIAESVAMAGKKALVFSMEMSSGQLISRSTASIGTIQFDKVRLAKFDDEEWTKVTATTSRLLTSGLIIDDSPALSVHELRARARRVHRSGLDLIVVDYLQLMSGEGVNQNEKVAAISRGLKALAKELNVPVIALSQLNRGLEQRQNKRPVMSDLRDSGAIEQDADVVLCLYRHDVYHPGCSAAGTAEILIRKQRNGPLGMVRLVFAGHYCRFENYMGDPNIPDDEGRAEQGNGQRKVERYKGGYDG